MRFMIMAGVTFLGLAATQANANLLLNAGFEAPVAPTGSFVSFNNGSTSITNWTVVGNEVSLINTNFSQNGVNFASQEGAQWLDLAGNGSNASEGVSQVVATTAGRTYQLSYYVGNTTGGGIFGTTSTVNVGINGSPTFSDTNSAVNASGLTWQSFTHTFLATGPSTTLAFLNGDPGSDNSNGLDNVVLLDVTTATPAPEPASLALFLLGATALLGARRRRA